MTKEISDAIEEQQFKQAALALIKSKHHHADGREVVLTMVDEQVTDLNNLERKLIEEEHKLRQLADDGQQNQEFFEKNTEEIKKPQVIEKEFAVVERKKQTVMASCNCGKTLFGSFSNEKSPGEGSFEIKSYDASGSSEVVSYSVFRDASAKESYSASGDVGKDYSSQ